MRSTSTSQSPHPLRTLIVYSPYPSHLIRPILNDFEKREHVKVEIKHGSTQVLLSNIHKKHFLNVGMSLWVACYQR